ncbi:FecR family protein [Porticoccus sp. GXU_MW_L64]
MKLLGKLASAELSSAELSNTKKSAHLTASPVATKPKKTPWKLSNLFHNPVGYALAGFLVIGLLVAYQFTGETEITQLAYSTKIGEQRQVALEDGSQILINTASTVTVDFQDNQRRIELQQGEAYFMVEKQPDRPFTVFTPQFKVTAIGTAFNVRLDGSHQVIVTEGTVQVAQHQSENNKTILLTAGESAGMGLVPEKNAAVNPDVELAWHKGILNFHRKTLQQAVTEFGRYSNVHFYVMDPQLQQTMIGGSFKIGDTQAFMSALSESLGVTFKRVGDKRIDIIHASEKE